jgi:hypothetical protein
MGCDCRKAELLFLSSSSKPTLMPSCLAGIGRAGVILTTLLRLMPTVRHCVTCLQSTHLGEAVIKYAQGLLRVVIDFRCFPFAGTDVSVSLLQTFVDTLRITLRSCLFLQLSWVCNLKTLDFFRNTKKEAIRFTATTVTNCQSARHNFPGLG